MIEHDSYTSKLYKENWDDAVRLLNEKDARIAELEAETFDLYAKSVSMFHCVPDDVIAEDIRNEYERYKVTMTRVAELERRLRRINAINDNPARFDCEIDELSRVL